MDGGLEDGYSGSCARVLGDQRPECGTDGPVLCACEKLGAEHGEVIGRGQGFGFGVEVLDAGLED